jgi:hypothetical protein
VLEVQPPLFTCGDCRFTSAIHGAWSVEDGRLVFRADADPQPGRGPDLGGCCESDRDQLDVDFTCIDAGGQVFTGDDLAALRASTEAARQAQYDEWARQDAEKAARGASLSP